MKYTELQNRNIENLNDKVYALRLSLSDLKDNIGKLKNDIGQKMVEHELSLIAYESRIKILKNSLYELISQRETQEEEYDAAFNKLDASRFNGFRDDRGATVPSLPVGPLAIVPLHETGLVPPPPARWTDEDAHIIHGKEQTFDKKTCGECKKEL